MHSCKQDIPKECLASCTVPTCAQANSYSRYQKLELELVLDVKNVFYVFYSGHVFLRFLTFFYFFPRIFIFK